MPTRDFKLVYPIKGIHKGTAYEYQPEGTSPDELNVRAFDVTLGRARGGQRGGHVKFLATQPGGANPVQDIQTVVTSVDPNAVSNAGIHVVGKNSSSNDTWKIDFLGAQSWVKDSDVGSGTAATDGSMATATDTSDKVWVFHKATAGAPGDRVTKYDNDGTQLLTIDTNTAILGSTSQGDMSISSTGVAICGAAQGATSPTRSAEVFNESGTLQWVGSFNAQANGCAWDSSGNLYVAYNRTSSLSLLRIGLPTSTVNGIEVATTQKSIDLVVDANDVAVDSNGNVFVALDRDATNLRSIVKIDADLTAISASYDTTTNVMGIFVDADDNVFACGARDATNARTVWKLTNDLATLSASADTGTTAWQVEAPGDGFAYVAGVRNTTTSTSVWKWDSVAGSLVNLYDTGADTKDIAVLGLTSAATRTVNMSTVIAGGIYGSSLTSQSISTGGSGALATASVDIHSTVLGQKVYYVDGIQYRVYDPSTNTTTAWTASSGVMPSSGANTARLIETWRDRIILSGLKGDDQNIFMSKVGDATNFNYPVSGTPTEIDPFQLGAGSAGRIGDVVTSLIPYSQEILIIGQDHNIDIMYGDPRSGGRLQKVSSSLGIAWGRPWAIDTEGIAYFFGSDGVVYRMVPNEVPKPMTDTRLDDDLSAINLASHRVKMAWSRADHGLHVYVTPIAQTTTTHYFWDKRLDAWHPDQIPNTFGPTAVHVIDGDDPNDRVVVLGGRDGYLRNIKAAADDDDGTAIASHVVFPPLLGPDSNEIGVKSIRADVAAGTNAITYDVRVASDAESAVSAASSITGSWTTAGRNHTRARAKGRAISVKLSNTANDSTWAIENMVIEGEVVGPVRA